MLIGATGKLAHSRSAFENAGYRETDDTIRWLKSDDAVVAVGPWSVTTLDSQERSAIDSVTGSWLALSGHPYHYAETPNNTRPHGIASLLLARLSAKGPEAISEFDGAFAVAWFDGRSRRLHLMRDPFGMEPLFYGELGNSILFGSRVRDLLRTGLLPGGLCYQGLAEYLVYCFIPGDATLDRNVRQVPVGSRIVVSPERGVMERRQFYHVSFAGPRVTDEAEIADQFRTLLERAVQRRIDESRLGIFLSGGMDSSSVVTFARRHRPEQINTFSYRCAGKSFDESVYARTLAAAMKTKHCEIEYGEENVLQIESAVANMDVPFCDIGLEMGTWLLGNAANQRVDLILTGDGGDELWASHPVYAAQRLLDMYERFPVPQVVRRTLQRLAATLPDSDQKRDLRVKVKRILPPNDLPRGLGPYRWRAYYSRQELESILTPEMATALRDRDPFQCVLNAYKGYDGPDDGLSRYIYNDYSTITAYYFPRLNLLRRFGIEVRCPFYDRALVEFGARIPAQLKLEGLERTKRLFRVAMEGVLPDAINHRKDKLGHSIPFKNWLRQDGPLAHRIAEVCSFSAIRARGLFRPEAVQRLLDEHRARRHNHSQRIWALHVLELWLRAREAQA